MTKICPSGYLFFPWEIAWSNSFKTDKLMNDLCEDLFGQENWYKPMDRNPLWRTTDSGLQFKEYDDAVYFWLSWYSDKTI